MKKIILILLFTAFSAYSQNRYSTVTTTSYTPLSYDELSYVANHKKSQYDKNQDYLYSLKDWIRKLSSQVTEESYRELLQTVYNDLVKIENKDLARYSTYLKQVEDGVKEIINAYNDFMKNNQGNNQSNESYYQNLLNQAVQMYYSGDYTGSISSFSKYLEVDMMNTNVLFLRAMSKSDYGDKQGAINDYDKIIELQSNYPITVAKIATVYNNKAYCLVGLKKYNEALPFVEKALELDKTEWFIWDTRGEIHYYLGNYDKSIQDMSKVLTIKYNSENAYFIRGLAYVKLSKKNEACRDLQEAKRLGKNEAAEALIRYCK